MTNARKSSEKYRHYYQGMLIALIAVIIFIILMIVIVLYQVMHRPLPVFIVTAPNGKSMRLTSFDEPSLLPSTLLSWASKAAVSAYTFDFVNSSKQINAARPYFTDSGWADYLGSVSGLIQDIAQKQLFVNSVVAGAAIISSQGVYPGKGYIWRVQLPFLVTYQSAEAISRKNFVIQMTIVKVSTRINPRGIGIDQFVMK